MNKHQLDKALRDAPEAKAIVDKRLHQDVMRAVRMAEPKTENTSLGWRIPAWGTALAVTLVTVFLFDRVDTRPSPLLTDSSIAIKSASLVVLGDKLASISDESLLPEKELKLELDRLKSDLQRFSFKS